MSETIREAARRWAPACEEYFEHFSEGVWDEFNQLQLILAENSVRIDQERGDLIVGHAGVDGIYFCFREGRSGVFAYYGIENQHVLVAPDLKSLVDAWNDRSLKL